MKISYGRKPSLKLCVSLFILELALALGWVCPSRAETYNDPAFTSEVVSTLPAYTVVGLDWSPDGRLFVWEKNGIVRVIKNGVLLTTPFIDLSSQVNTFDDRGMWGLAFDPDFSNNGYIYLSYVYEGGNNPNDSSPKTSRLSRVQVDPTNPDVALPNSEHVILGTISTPPCSAYLPGSDCIPVDGGSHVIGKLMFGPDGKLFFGNGDGSDGDYLSLQAQDIDSWSGKILRINPDGSAPGDNYFDDGSNSIRSKIWLYGVRNPFGFSLHPSNGYLYFGDVGWNTWEEMNRGVRGGNFGWPCYEGTGLQPYFQSNFSQCSQLLSIDVVSPIYTYNHSTGSTAIIGGPFYTANVYPQTYQGNLFFADYSGNWIRRMVLDANGNPSSTQDFATNVQAPVAIAQGPDGLLYYLSFTTGEIRRIRYNGPSAIASATPNYGYSPLSVNFSSAGSSFGTGITYLWDFGDGSISTSANPSHTYTVSGVMTFTVRLTVTNSTNQSSSATLSITVGSTPPTPTISAPADGTGFFPGQVVAYQGSATDPEEGALGSSALKWMVLLHHNSHIHTFVGGSGSSGSFVVENHGTIGTFSYEIVLTATDSSGISTSTSVNVPILAPPPDTELPTAPSNLTSTAAGTSQINLSWDASTDNIGVTSYLVERCQGAGCSNFAQVGTPSGTSYNDAGLTSNTSYSYRVRATDAAGNFSGYSNTASATTASIPPLPAGIAAAYSFNEGTGTTVTDVSGNGNTGTISGATWTAQGKYGNALSFNGSNSLVAISAPVSSSLNVSSAMTLEAWVYPTAVQSGWRTIMQRETDAYFLNASTSAGALQPGGGGTFGGATDFTTAPSAMGVNTWNYVALTYDGTILRLYVNGTQVASKARTGAVETNANPLRIGGNVPYGEYFQGLIDEVRVYNRALSAAEIQTDMNTPMADALPSDTQAPTDPGTLSATAASASQINLSWGASTDNVGVTGYQVERCQGEGCSNFAQVGTATGTSYNDTGLTASTSYSYRVRATDAAGNFSGYSNTSSASTLAGTGNQPPNFTSTAPINATVGMDYSYTATATDPDGNNPVSFVLVPGAFPSGMILSGATVNWTPVSGQEGAQSFTIRATDNLGAFSDQVNNVIVSTTSVNTAPTANADTFLYRANVTRTVNYVGSLGLGVLANDSDAENNPLSASLVAGSLTNGGTLNLASDGSFTYLRATGNNNVSFSYQAFDGTLLSQPATGATVLMRVDARPTTTGDNCTYDRSASTVTQPTRCTVTATRTVLMNVVANDIDPNTTTNIPTDGVGDAVTAGSMLVTVAGTGVDVAADPACGQNALGAAPGARATIVNNCNGTLTVTMTASNTQNIQYSYTVQDDLGATSNARSVTLTSQQ